MAEGARGSSRRLPASHRGSGQHTCDTRSESCDLDHGHDWSGRFPLIAQAATALRVTSCLIDGEAVACDADGLAVFERLRGRRQDAASSCMPST